MPVISVTLDVKKVEKERLFAGKNGAMYLDVTLIPTTNDKYGNDFVAIQRVSKEERLRGVKGAILGHAKFMGTSAHKPAQREEPPEQDRSDLPF